MQGDFNVPVILAAVKRAGDSFRQDYKKTAIPRDKAALLRQLAAIDAQCLASLKADLTAAFPETPWHVGDEFDSNGQQRPLDLPAYWLCDAMDGAIQYVQHLPGWTINLVLVRQDRPHFSVIYDPLAHEVFWAQAGAGAWLNDTPLALSPTPRTDADVMMLAVFEYGHQDEAHPMPDLNQRTGAAVTKLLSHFGVVRNFGPHGLQLASVGAGRIDLFYQEGLDTYNWLAGILIAQEAGADILTTDGRPWRWGAASLLVAAPGVAAPFLHAQAPLTA